MDPTYASYLHNGYLLFEGFFDRTRIQSILEESKQVFFSQMHRQGIDTTFDINDEARFRQAMALLFASDFEAFSNCGKQVQHLISLHRLSVETRIENLLHGIGLNRPNICTRPVLFFNHPSLAKDPVYHTVFSHQDWRSMQGSLDAVVIWCPLIDVDHSLGALEIVPGSHKKGLLTESVEAGFGKVSDTAFNEEDWISVEVKQGDALLFSSFLVHRSGNNITDRIRWSCHFRYNNLNEPSFISRKYHHNYVYHPKNELRTPDYPTKEDMCFIFERED